MSPDQAARLLDVLQKESAKLVFQVPCQQCQGTGRVCLDDYLRIVRPCFPCGGSGKVEMRVDSGTLVRIERE